MRIKANSKPKAIDKGKENKAFFSKPGRVYKAMKKIPTCGTSHVLGNISNSAANHSKFKSGNKKPREI